MKYRVSAEDPWSAIPNYTGSVDVMMLSAVQPERVVAGESSVVTLTLSSGSMAETGDHIRFVKNPAGFTSENPCVEYGYPLPESMTISFLSAVSVAGGQYVASTNGNDFTSLLSANDQVIVVDRDGAEKKSYKMTIAEITPISITFVEFLDDIVPSKEFILQLVNDYSIEVVDGVARTTVPVAFKTSSADVTVCYARQPVERNSWFALENGFHVLAVETMAVEGVMAPSRAIAAVKDQPVTIQFRGIGLRYADRAFFVKQGESCADASAAQQLDATSEYTFAEFVFAEAERYELCYMYSSTITAEATEYLYRKVEGMQVAVHTVLGVTGVSKGRKEGFVANYAKTLTFSLVQYMDLTNSFYAVPSSESACSEEASVSMTVSAVNATSFETTFNTVGVQLQQPLVLCFRFGSYPAQMYPAITFTVSELYGLTGNLVDADGYIDQAVVSGEKPLSIYGMQLATGDYIKFINNDEDCDSDHGFGRRLPDEIARPEDDPNASSVTCPETSGLCQATLHFTKETRENVHACYWFVNDPGYWKSYPYSLRITQPGDLTFTSVEGLSDRGLVAGQTKRFQISGNGATYDDKVYLIHDTDACAEANALDGRVFRTQVTEVNNAFAVVVDLTYLTAADDLKLCYQFSTLPVFNDKVSGTFHVYAVTGIDATHTAGSVDTVIVGNPKNFFFSGAGFSEGDKTAWISGEEECSTSVHIGSVSRSEGANAYFSQVMFSAVDAGKVYHLCYQFLNEQWNEYPAIQVTVKQYNGLSGASHGGADVFVVGVPKSYYLDDENGVFGYSTNDKIYLVHNRDDCADPEAHLYTANVVSRARTNGHFMFTLDLTEEFAGKTCYVCYGFGDETPIETPQSIQVKSMPGFVGVLDGTKIDMEQSVDAVVLNVEKKLVFPSNKFIADTDRFLFVASESECAAAVAFQTINVEGDLLYFSTLRTNAEEVNAELYGCMKFGVEPALFLQSVHVTVKNFMGMAAVAGEDTVVVLNESKSFVIDMNGGAKAGDSVILASTACTDDNAANRMVFPVVVSDAQAMVSVLVSDAAIEATTPRTWYMCYRFVNEKPAATEVMMTVKGFLSAEAMSTNKGDKLKAIVKKEKVYTFAAEQGAAEGDLVALGCSCDALLTPVTAVDESASAVLVLSEKPSCAVGVCYTFGNETSVFYNWSLTPFELTSIDDVTAFTKDMVSGNVYRLRFGGSSGLEDAFKLVDVNAECAGDASDYSDAFGAVLPNIAVEEVQTSEDNAYTVLKLSGAGKLEDYFASMQASMVDGKWTGLNAVLIGGVYTYIQRYDAATRMLYLTEKIETTVGATFKLVHATKLSAVPSGDGYLVDVTLPVTATSEGMLKVCYAFAGDAFFSYDEYKVRVRQITPSSLTVSGSSSTVFLSNMRNLIAVEGLNLGVSEASVRRLDGAGDKLRFVHPTDLCSATPVFVADVTVQEGRATAEVVSAPTGSYRVCYEFAGLGMQATTLVVDVVDASVSGQTSESNVWFSVANQAHAITYTTQKSESFTQTRTPSYVSMSNSGYIITGVLDTLMVPEGELILYSASNAECTFAFTAAHDVDVLGEVSQFAVTVENHQLSAVTLTVTLKAGESEVTKVVNDLQDGVNTIVFDAQVEGWSALAFAGPVSYTIKVSSSSIAIFTFVRAYSTMVFSTAAPEAVKYVQSACSEEPAASSVMELGADRTVSWLFTQGSGYEQWSLCYKIGGSGFVNAPMEFNMRVGEVTELVPEVGAADRVVVGIPKTFTVEGSWIQEEDTLFFQKDEVSTPVLTVDGNNTFTLGLSTVLTAEPMSLHYRFNSMPVKEYALTMTQCYVNAAEAESNYAVSGIPITVTRTGNGFSAADSMYFVNYPDDCSVDGGYTASFEFTSVANGAVTAVVTMNELAAGKEVKLCYAFAGEGAVAISSRIHVSRLDDMVVIGEGSKNVAVVNQIKAISVVGLYLVQGDRVSFHRTADCEESSTVASFPVTELDTITTTYLFTEGSNGVAYTMCYHFGTNPLNVKMYPQFNVVVKEFNGFKNTLSDASINFFVARNPKPVRVVADGFAAGDKIAFAPAVEGITDVCSDFLTLSVDGVEATSITLESSMAVVNIFDEVWANEGLINVCYKFGDEGFVRIPTAYILYALSVSTEEGAVDSIVANEPKTFVLTRSHPDRADFFYFVPATATACDRSERVMDPYMPGLKSTVEIGIARHSNNTYYQLCYEFAGTETQLLGANGPFYPAKWQLMVKAVETFESGTIVAAMTKSIPVSIYGESEEDEAFFATGEDCTARCTECVVSVESSSLMTVTFSPLEEPATYYLCYQFAGNKVKRYDTFSLSVVELQSVTTPAGEATEAIWLRPKSFTFSGVGVSEGDRVKYVPFGMGCEAEVEYMKDATTHETVPYYTLNTERTITAYFAQESTVEEPYEVCYQFGEEAWMNYGPTGAYGANSTFYMVVFGRPAVTALSGAKDVFVKDVAKTLVYEGFLITANDRIKIVEGTNCAAAAFAAKFDNMLLGESKTLTFTFDVYAATMTMCFRFADDTDYVTLFPITVKALESAAFVSGHPQVLVASQAKSVALAGDGLSTEDKMLFTFSTCDAAVYEFNVTRGEAFESEVMIPQALVNLPLTLCYQFGAEAPVAYNFMSFTVKGVSGIAIVNDPEHSVNVIVKGEDVSGAVSGVGLSSEDQVMFVPAGMECAAENSVKTQTLTEMTISYAFTDAQSDAAYDLCYVFRTGSVAEAPMKYEEYSFAVRVVPTMTSTIPALSNDGAVVNAPKSFTLSTNLAGEGDFVIMSPAADACAGENAVLYPVTESKVVSVNLTHSEAEPWTVCYQFANWAKPFVLGSFVSKSVLSFAATNPDSIIIANVPKEFTLQTHGASVGDKAKMVLGENCDEGEWIDVTEGKVVFALAHALTPYKLCYQFLNEEPVLYPEFTATVFYLNTIVIDDGARNDAILFHEDNAIRFTGMTFPGDKIYPLSNPLNAAADSFSNEDCLRDVTLDDYYSKEADGAYHVSVDPAGSVLICYLFDGETTPFLTQFNLLVLGVINPAIVADGVELGTSTNLWAVKNVTSQFRVYSSDSVHEAKYKWVSANATECDGPDVFGDVDGVEMSFDAESGYMVSDFAFDDVTEEKWKLCFQFSGKRWMFVSMQSQGDVYPPITVESRGLLAVYDSEGSMFLQILPGIPAQWVVVVANGKPGDRMRLVSGISCTARSEIVAETEVKGLNVDWNVDTVLPEVHVCYGYNNEDSVATDDHFWVMYEDYVIDVMYVSDVTTVGNKHLAIVNVPKTYTLVGSHVDAVDSLFFVPVDAKCDNATAVVTAPVVNGEAVVVFTEAVETTLKMCVWFAGQSPVAVTPSGANILEVNTVEVTAMESLEGYDNAGAVVTQEKSFRLLGSHTEFVKSVIFTTSTCDNVFAQFAAEDSAFVALFPAHSEGVQLTLCVKYEGEEPLDTTINMSLKSLNSIRVNKGDARVLIWGDRKTMSITGYGVNAEEDRARFVLASSVKNDDEE